MKANSPSSLISSAPSTSTSSSRSHSSKNVNYKNDNYNVSTNNNNNNNINNIKSNEDNLINYDKVTCSCFLRMKCSLSNGNHKTNKSCKLNSTNYKVR